MNHYNIPVFIPHLGCPFHCIFCDQKTISGKKEIPVPEDITEIIERVTSTIDPRNSEVELAFFGGSFTCLEKELQREYLAAAQPYIKDKSLTGIRISTRPDYITDDILDFLRSYHVKTIELGAQSMRDHVLMASQRGHSEGDVIKSAELIREHGFYLGIQTMIGLPGSSLEDDKYTAGKVIELKPDYVRIYPVLVIQGTMLEKMCKHGSYKPLSLETAADHTAEVLTIYIEQDINVIKVGLHPSDDYMPGGKLIAGPFHPAFREIAMSKIWRRQFINFLDENNSVKACEQDITLKVGSGQYNFAIGYQASNRNLLKTIFRRVRFEESAELKRLEFEVDYR